jgi:hypothetical protein
MKVQRTRQTQTELSVYKAKLQCHQQRERPASSNLKTAVEKQGSTDLGDSSQALFSCTEEQVITSPTMQSKNTKLRLSANLKKIDTYRPSKGSRQRQLRVKSANSHRREVFSEGPRKNFYLGTLSN